MLISKKKIIKLLQTAIVETARKCGRNLSEKQKIEIFNKLMVSSKNT